MRLGICRGPELIAHRVADGDDFIGNLWKVHCRVQKEGYVQARLTVSLFHKLTQPLTVYRLYLWGSSGLITWFIKTIQTQHLYL